MSPDTFGKRLRNLRKKLKMSQTDVATEIADVYGIRMSQTTYSVLECSDAPPPNLETLHALSDYFGVHVDYFKPRDNAKINAAIEYIENLRDGKECLFDIARGNNRRRGVEDGRYDEDEYFDT